MKKWGMERGRTRKCVRVRRGASRECAREGIGRILTVGLSDWGQQKTGRRSEASGGDLAEANDFYSGVSAFSWTVLLRRLVPC